MPHFNLTVNNRRGIIVRMCTLHLTPDSLPKAGETQIVRASSLPLSLSLPVRRFFRHGWQSWALCAWLDASELPIPVRAAEFRMKDEDPGYALHPNHISAWVGALELNEDDIVLLGALDLGGRVEWNGTNLIGFYEPVGSNPPSPSTHDWLLARGTEDEVFSNYAKLLEVRLGKGRFEKAPRVWCSWYSLYRWATERILLKALADLSDMPFDVFQVDDGWQLAHGDWDANLKFPSGMKSLAEKISGTGRIPGIWLAPFMVSPDSKLARKHPDWLLRDKQGDPVRAGITWSGNPLGLDVSHPAVLEWLDALIRKVRGWGYGYLKLDFLYIGALIGKRHQNIPREIGYRNALQVLREAAGSAYVLACGAPIIPSLGLCDGLRIGPDVSPFWLNKPLSVWLSNPNDTSTQNAIRTSLHRLWLHPVVNVDPDIAFFRSKYNRLTPDQKRLLQDLGLISGFKATSDLPQWLTESEKRELWTFLEATPTIRKQCQYEYQIDGRPVNLESVIPIQATKKAIPIWLARNLGLMKIAVDQALPAMFESFRLRGRTLQDK